MYKILKKWFIHPIKRRIAKFYLFILKKFTGIKVIGITGSAGKTTTKEMLASILKLDSKTVYTVANIDPVYNIPTTILKCRPNTKYLILEMGVEYPGEMDFYLWLAKVDIGVITNIYPTHTEFLGDVGGVFREKGKLVTFLAKGNYAVLNNCDKQLIKLKGKLRAKEVWYGNGTFVMSSLEQITKDYKTKFLLIFDQDSSKRIKVALPVIGQQFVSNALAAASVAKILGISLETVKMGLEKFKPERHRMEIIKHGSGAIIVDDSYNNNPKAAEEALDTFDSISWNNRRVIVFGDMLELGNWEYKYHKELGEYISKMKTCLLICVGKASKTTAEIVSKIWGKQNVVVLNTWAEVLNELKPHLKKGCYIFIKGSRSVGLDKVIDRL